MSLKDNIAKKLSAGQPGARSNRTVFEFRRHQKEIMESLAMGATIKMVWEELKSENLFSGSYSWFAEMVKQQTTALDHTKKKTPSASPALPVGSGKGLSASQNNTLKHQAKPDEKELI